MFCVFVWLYDFGVRNIRCDACSSQILTYFPPCSECKKSYYNKKVCGVQLPCSSCGSTFCDDCRDCGDSSRLMWCDECIRPYCDDCVQCIQYSVCDVKICEDCWDRGGWFPMCSVCDLSFCEDCANVFYCEECEEAKCVTCKCSVCKKCHCEDDGEKIKCEKCGEILCSEEGCAVDHNLLCELKDAEICD